MYFQLLHKWIMRGSRRQRENDPGDSRWTKKKQSVCKHQSLSLYSDELGHMSDSVGKWIMLISILVTVLGKDAPSFDENENHQSADGWIKKNPENQSEWRWRRVLLKCSNSERCSTLCDAHVLVCMPDSIPEDLLPHLDQGITELLDSVSCTWNMMSQRCWCAISVRWT